MTKSVGSSAITEPNIANMKSSTRASISRDNPIGHSVLHTAVSCRPCTGLVGVGGNEIGRVWQHISQHLDNNNLAALRLNNMFRSDQRRDCGRKNWGDVGDDE